MEAQFYRKIGTSSVGTGGKDHGAPGPYTPINHSVIFNTDTLGVLKMTLYPQSLAWQFIPVAGATFMTKGLYPVADIRIRSTFRLYRGNV